MSKKKRKLEFSPRVPSKMENYVDHNRCIYCGKPLPADMDERTYVLVHSRHFPVCGEACSLETQAYVERDAKYKTLLYIGFFLAAVSIFMTSIFTDGGSAFQAVLAVSGVFLVAFPYPITSFETFMSMPIRRVTWLTRGIGLVIIAMALILRIFG